MPRIVNASRYTLSGSECIINSSGLLFKNEFYPSLPADFAYSEILHEKDC